jgi:predicted transcriptional regulator
MEVNLSPDLQARLNRLAADRGSDMGTLVQEAVERLVDYDECFSGKSRGAWLPRTAANSSTVRTLASESTTGIEADAHSVD